MIGEKSEAENKNEKQTKKKETKQKHDIHLIVFVCSLVKWFVRY